MGTSNLKEDRLFQHPRAFGTPANVNSRVGSLFGHVGTLVDVTRERMGVSLRGMRVIPQGRDLDQDLILMEVPGQRLGLYRYTGIRGNDGAIGRRRLEIFPYNPPFQLKEGLSRLEQQGLIPSEDWRGLCVLEGALFDGFDGGEGNPARTFEKILVENQPRFLGDEYANPSTQGYAVGAVMDSEASGGAFRTDRDFNYVNAVSPDVISSMQGVRWNILRALILEMVRQRLETAMAHIEEVNRGKDSGWDETLEGISFFIRNDGERHNNPWVEVE